jgi:predicted transcriptional regulator
MSQQIIMSLRPIFAEAIYQGLKHFEFRRVKVKIHGGDHVFIYESAPISCLTGEFYVGRVVTGNPNQVLNLEATLSSKIAAEQYLWGAKIATAIEVLLPQRWRQPKPLQAIAPGCRPPQSYTFIRV